MEANQNLALLARKQGVIASMRIEILGADWTVVVVPFLDEMNQNFGMCYYDTKTIYVSYVGSTRALMQTFAHECVHALLWELCHHPANRGLTDQDPYFSAEQVCDIMSFHGHRLNVLKDYFYMEMISRVPGLVEDTTC